MRRWRRIKRFWHVIAHLSIGLILSVLVDSLLLNFPGNIVYSFLSFPIENNNVTSISKVQPRMSPVRKVHSITTVVGAIGFSRSLAKYLWGLWQIITTMKALDLFCEAFQTNQTSKCVVQSSLRPYGAIVHIKRQKSENSYVYEFFYALKLKITIHFCISTFLYSWQ